MKRLAANKIRGIYALGISICLLGGCNNQDAVENPVTPSITKSQLEAAADLRVLFAHQSVGNNIIDGIKSLAEQQDVGFNIVQTQTIPPSGSGIYHFKVGLNGEPDGKIAAYEDALAQEALANVDVAMMKLCYIDFEGDVDPLAVADHYTKTIENLQQQHPDVHFVAVTAPLTTVQTGPKAWIKRLLGREPSGYRENARRDDFNDYLRQHFSSANLFDLAAIETAGKRLDNDAVALDPSLTYDGGHLNERGKELVATELLKLLATFKK